LRKPSFRTLTSSAPLKVNPCGFSQHFNGCLPNSHEFGPVEGLP